MIYLISMQNPFQDTNGVACHIQDLIRGLLEYGQEVKVIHPYDDLFGRLRIQKIGFKIFAMLYTKIKLELIFLLKLYFLSQILKSKINRIEDGSAVFNCEDIISLYSFSKSKKSKFRCIYTTHFIAPPWEEFQMVGYFKKESILYKFFVNKLLNSLKIINLEIVSVSDSTLEMYKKMNPDYLKHFHKLNIIYPGLDLRILNKNISEKILKHKYIVNVGKVCDVKNQILLAEIAIQLKQLGLLPQFILVGEWNPGYHQKLIDYLKENGIEKQFIFTGAVSREEVYQYMKNADLMIHTSKLESFGMVLVEAMGLGCPVLAFNYEALNEIMPETPKAILNNSKNLEKNVEMIRHILNNPIELEEIKKMQKQVFDSKFSFQKMIESFINIYNIHRG